jgi:two-component system, response regulator PdtaR
MIVEDQALLAMELEMVLADSGCAVVGCAADQAGALTLAERERPDLALVDVNLLDGMTGPLVAEALVRKFGAAVVFLTANPEQIPDGYAGALGSISKPIDDRTVNEVIDFAREMIVHHTVGQVPPRFRLAPWMMQQTPDVRPH